MSSAGKVVGSIYSGQEPIISRRVFRHFTWLPLHAGPRRPAVSPGYLGAGLISNTQPAVRNFRAFTFFFCARPDLPVSITQDFLAECRVVTTWQQRVNSCNSSVVLVLDKRGHGTAAPDGPP
jgi:hypothetical protein